MSITVHAAGGVNACLPGAGSRTEATATCTPRLETAPADVPAWAEGWNYWARLPDGARIATREALYDYPFMGQQWAY